MRIFTLKEARALLPHIMRITARHREEMEHVWSELNHRSSALEIEVAHLRLNVVRNNWYREIRAPGTLPRRLWEVGFDFGDGYCFSWRLGETDIDYVSYENHGRAVIRSPIR